MTDWISTPLDSRVLRGALDLERTASGVRPHRLPAWAREQFPDPFLSLVEAQPSGVRLVFRSAATAVELDVLPTRTVFQDTPPLPAGVYDLLVDGRLAGRAGAPGGNVLSVDTTTWSTALRTGPAGTVRFAGLSSGVKDISPSSRSPTGSTRTPPVIAASANASPSWSSAPTARSPGQEVRLA
ncbi:hypothetical protein EKH77_00970 [Streptomyces luteoverticillatus]|uniref:Uncharacterized protein n=1 Tax=Streptomyces luteoverticillatus TaxID=66425 RepID=A0A3Q9FS30_STRLT|nr:hypothetical protein EKH77_00970 [Streptomyces luteoverticillatus]